MKSGSSEGAEGPLPCEHDDAEDDVEDLEDGDGLHGSVEVFGEEIPEDLGPEDAVDTG